MELKGTAMNTISRRRFLGTMGATAVAATGLSRLHAGEPAKDNIRLGMMLQGGSLAEVQERAKRIASVGFKTVQLTFFFQPTAAELKTIAQTLQKLKLKTVALGTYFNLFRPDAPFLGSNRATMRLAAAHAELFDCKQFVTWSGSYSDFGGADPRNHTAEAVAHIHRAIREVILPIIQPIGGRAALEPYYPHVVGTLELAKEAFAPFPADEIGLLCDPPNFISPALIPSARKSCAACSACSATASMRSTSRT